MYYHIFSTLNSRCVYDHYITGQIDVDQAQLTGESLPVTMFAGDSCMMGSTVVRGKSLSVGITFLSSIINPYLYMYACIYDTSR